MPAFHIYATSLVTVSYTHLDVYKRQLQDRIRNEDIRAELEVEDINEIISAYRRQWWDHLQRMTEDRLPKAALNYKAIGRRDVGRPRMRWVPEQVYIT